MKKNIEGLFRGRYEGF